MPLNLWSTLYIHVHVYRVIYNGPNFVGWSVSRNGASWKSNSWIQTTCRTERTCRGCSQKHSTKSGPKWSVYNHGKPQNSIYNKIIIRFYRIGAWNYCHGSTRRHLVNGLAKKVTSVCKKRNKFQNRYQYARNACIAKQQWIIWNLHYVSCCQQRRTG